MADRPDCVASHHLNVFGSGVSRFNEIMAERLGIDLVWVFDPRLHDYSRPLMSFKVAEMSEREQTALGDVLDQLQVRPAFLLHEYTALPVERRLVQLADPLYCGNLEVEAQVEDLNSRREALWSPGLILDARIFRPAEVSVFSFGMAHKIRVDTFRRLRDLLKRSGRSYTVYVSAANHETASLEDAQLIFDEMHELFPDQLYFMGNLSDVAVYNYIQGTTFFAAFFQHGARDNNGSIAAAMEHGAVVVTNLDDHSPTDFVHLENVIDINRAEELPDDPLVLRRISVAAMETARRRSWDALVDRLQNTRVSP